MDTILNNDEVQTSLQDLREIFSVFDDPLDKFSQIIDMGKKSKGLFAEEKNRYNQILGCSSEAWVVTKIDINDCIIIRTDSDALIVKGLLSILEFILSNKNKSVVKSITAQEILNNINLNRSITSQRTNGFISALNKIKSQVKKINNG